MKRILILILALLSTASYGQEYFAVQKRLTKEQRDSIKTIKDSIKFANRQKVGTKEIRLFTNFSNRKEAAEYVISYLLRLSIKPATIDANFFFVETEMMKSSLSDIGVGPGSLNTFKINFFFIEENNKVTINATGKWCSNVQSGYTKDIEEHQLIFNNKKAFTTYDAFLQMEQIVLNIPHIAQTYIK